MQEFCPLQQITSASAPNCSARRRCFSYFTAFLLGGILNSAHAEDGTAQIGSIKTVANGAASTLATGAVSTQRKSYELNEAGVKLILAGKREEGLQKLKQAIEFDSNNSTALYNIAGIYISDGEPELALEAMKKAVVLVPADINFLNRFAEAHFATGQIKEAIAAYERIVQLSADHEQSLLRLGTLYALEKRWDKAEENLRKACHADPSNPVALSNLGNVLLVKEKYEEAIKVLSSAQDIFGPSPENEVALGVACEATGENPTALQHYRLAKKLGSSDPQLDEHISSLESALARGN